MPDPHMLRVMLADAGFDHPDAEIAFLGDGCDHDNYLVDRQWVFRLPKTPEHEVRLDCEAALLSMLEAKTVRVPRPAGPFASAAWPLRYSVYRFLEGTSADTAEAIDVSSATEALAGLLAELHSIDVQNALALGLPREHDPVRGWLNAVQRGAPVLGDVMVHIPRERLDPTDLPEPLGEVVLHNDLWAEHILVDETGRVSAVIDWGDAAIGEPALDYAGLLAWQGRAFLTETLERAGISWNEGDITRAHFFAVTAALHSIALGRQMHKPGWVRSGEVALSHAGITIPQSHRQRNS